MCGRHYQRLMRYGDPLGGPEPRPTPRQRMEASFEEDASGCWLWTKLLDGDGYASFCINRRNRTGHKVMWEMTRGPVPEGMELDHTCRVRHCVNPQHLELVTHQVNVRRSAACFDSRTTCRNGLHDITKPENVYRRENGHRRCRPCMYSSQSRTRIAREGTTP